jgi:hypothetical protein
VVKDTATFDAESPRVLKSLSERSDHVALCYAWLQYLIWSARTRIARYVGPDGHSSLERWVALIGQVGRSLPTHPKPYEWIRDEKPHWRNDRIYALLAVSTFNSPPNGGAIAELLKTCLTRGFVRSHGIEQLEIDQQSCNLRIIALAVASIKEPADWFKDVWAAIFSHRDRARRSRLNHNDDFQNVGQVAVFWALAGLAQLPSDSPAARSLWVELEVAVRESALTDTFRTADDAWCVAVRRLAAHWISIFTDDPVKGARGSLDDFLMNWAEPDADFAEIVSELACRGVTADQFRRSISDGDLLRAALQEARHSHQLTRRPLPQFNLEELAAAIDAVSPPGA